MDILEKRRRENWNIVFWITPRGTILQIEPCYLDGGESNENACVDVEFHTFDEALKFARKMCRRTAENIRREYVGI